MNKKELDKIKDLLKQFSKEIHGTFLCYDQFPVDICVIKEDFLLRFQDAVKKDKIIDDYRSYEFRFLTPLNLLDTTINISSNALRFFVSVNQGEYYFTDVKDYVVKVKDDSKTIALTQALINDYHFNLLLKNHIKSWKLRYHENIVSVVGFEPINAFNKEKNLTCDDLLDIYHLLIEFKKALEYHYKRI